MKKYLVFLQSIVVLGCVATYKADDRDSYFVYTGFFGLERYDSRTGIYERRYCGRDPDRIFIEPGIVDVRRLIKAAKRINAEKISNPGLFVKAADGTLVEEICVVGPCGPPVIEYGSAAAPVELRWQCSCEREELYYMDEFLKLEKLVREEFNKADQIKKLPDSNCYFK